MFVMENDLPSQFYNGARKHDSLRFCGTKAMKDFVHQTNGQPFTLYDQLKFTLANGDLPLIDRIVKNTDPISVIRDADEYVDWL